MLGAMARFFGNLHGTGSARAIVVTWVCLFTMAGPLTAQYVPFGKNKVQYTPFKWHVLSGANVDVYYYPEEEVLLSGYVEGADQIGNRPAMVWLRSGRGQLVLYGFNPQFRASTPATYKLLFNALLLSRLEE